MSLSDSDLDALYGHFVVAMERTGSTKEALRETILRAAGSNQPGGEASAETGVLPSPPATRAAIADGLAVLVSLLRERRQLRREHLV